MMEENVNGMCIHSYYHGGRRFHEKKKKWERASLVDYFANESSGSYNEMIEGGILNVV